MYCRYQKKIGSYDKQQWEKTLEQKILLSALHLPLKSTKLKKDLIDVDLVRGEDFIMFEDWPKIANNFCLFYSRFHIPQS